jgi:urease accessory protein
MIAAAPLSSEIFANNRAVGRIAFSAIAADGRSRRGRVHESGSLRVRFPNAGHAKHNDTLEAVIINTAGGMAGGDRYDVDIEVEANAHLTVTTAAAEKIYRSLGPPTQVGVKIDIDDGGLLAWLPQETLFFDRARLQRSFDANLKGAATLILAEALILGRSAMGESVLSGHLLDRWCVRLDGRLVFADTVRLDGRIADCLAERPVAAGCVAFASLLKIPGCDQDVAKVRAMQQDFAGEVGSSSFNNVMFARFVAADAASLRADLLSALNALGTVEIPRLLSN